jgi:protoporphyrinogen oxidase
MKVAVIGAGPAGITAAYQLAKNNVSVDVYEASDAVGGMAKTIELWNQKVDLGPHRFFSSDPRVNEVWKEVVGSDYDLIDRLTRIYYKNRFFYYPLKPLNALLNLGLLQAASCVVSFLRQNLRKKPEGSESDDGSFEDWVVQRFGRRLFEIFFKTYSEKLWGIPCSKLDADFAAQRIKKLSLMEAIKSAVFGNKGNKHKTLVDNFAYPHEGSGIVYKRMADYVSSHGGRILLNTPVKRVCTENNKAIGIELTNDELVQYDHIISTMPLTAMVKQLPGTPKEIIECASSLRFRNTILVFLKVEATDLFPDNWLYIHSDNLRTGRITNFRNWSPKLYGRETSSILALEYWCYDQDPIWNYRDYSLVDLAKSELRATGLLEDAKIPEGYVHRVKNCYPVYERGYKEKLKPIEEYLKTIDNLSVIGRYGAFKYNNQDHSILMGLLAAQNITSKAANDLWEINTDYEYQESAEINDTGLDKPSTQQPVPAWGFNGFSSFDNNSVIVSSVTDGMTAAETKNYIPQRTEINAIQK